MLMDERADHHSAYIYFMNARLARAEWSARQLTSQAGWQATATARGSWRVAGRARHHKTTCRRCAVREPADPRAPASQAAVPLQPLWEAG